MKKAPLVKLSPITETRTVSAPVPGVPVIILDVRDLRVSNLSVLIRLIVSVAPSSGAFTLATRWSLRL